MKLTMARNKHSVAALLLCVLLVVDTAKAFSSKTSTSTSHPWFFAAYVESSDSLNGGGGRSNAQTTSKFKKALVTAPPPLQELDAVDTKERFQRLLLAERLKLPTNNEAPTPAQPEARIADQQQQAKHDERIHRSLLSARLEMEAWTKSKAAPVLDGDLEATTPLNAAAETSAQLDDASARSKKSKAYAFQCSLLEARLKMDARAAAAAVAFDKTKKQAEVQTSTNKVDPTNTFASQQQTFLEAHLKMEARAREFETATSKIKEAIANSKVVKKQDDPVAIVTEEVTVPEETVNEDLPLFEDARNSMSEQAIANPAVLQMGDTVETTTKQEVTVHKDTPKKETPFFLENANDNFIGKENTPVFFENAKMPIMNKVNDLLKEKTPDFLENAKNFIINEGTPLFENAKDFIASKVNDFLVEPSPTVAEKKTRRPPIDWSTVSPSDVSSALIDAFTPEKGVRQFKDDQDSEIALYIVSRLFRTILDGGRMAYFLCKTVADAASPHGEVAVADAAASRQEVANTCANMTKRLASVVAASAALSLRQGERVIEYADKLKTEAVAKLAEEERRIREEEIVAAEKKVLAKLADEESRMRVAAGKKLEAERIVAEKQVESKLLEEKKKRVAVEEKDCDLKQNSGPAGEEETPFLSLG